MSSSTEQRKLAAIMFTDMVGYSALSQRDDKLALELLEEHREILRKIFPEFNGTEIKTIGDAFLVEFQSALEAAQCAIAIQRALAKRNADAPAERQIQVRIGVHIGDVVHRAGDVYGDGVNIASRIEPLADAGGICISMDVERQIRNAVETRFEKLAPTDLKNISVPMELFRIVLPWEQKSEIRSKIRRGEDQTSEGRQKVAAPSRRFALIGAVALLLIIAFGWWWIARSHKNPVAASLLLGPSQPQNIPEKSVAVLPFENLSDDKSNAYFADGVQDEILTDLAKVADLKVISRTSVMQYRNAAIRNLREIGQQLGVAHVLEGSVQRAANKIRINAQLIDARNDAHLWAQTYDRDLADIFAIQSEIAKTIAEQLKVHLSPSEKAAIAQAPTNDVKANDLFLRAGALDATVDNPNAKQNLLEAVGLVEEALRRDPNFLWAHCLLCQIHLDLYWYGMDHTVARREQARAALESAERIQPNAGEVHLQKGLYLYHGFRDYPQARVQYEVARQSLPNFGRIYLNIGVVDRRQARWDDAIKNLDRAVQLDPRNFGLLTETAFTYAALKRFPEAIALLQRAVEISPGDYFARIQLAEMPFYEKADIQSLREKLAELEKEGPEATANLCAFYVLLARVERDASAAKQAIGYIPPEGTIDEAINFLMPHDWFAGLVAHTFGDADGAQRAFTAARVIAAKTVQEQPDYAPAWSMLGMIDAGLGRKAEAIAEGKRGCELLSISKDSWEGPLYVANLALIYTWLGEKDLALEQLEISAKAPDGISYGELKLDPTWDPLRGDPRFEKIVATLAPK
jgi:TolB-like protein/class 3 adenylate cyclase